jgi:uncharacterized protein YbbK (DUF523 family)
MSEHPAGFDWSRPKSATPDDPLRVLFSACVLGHATGWDGNAYPEPLAQRLARLPQVTPIHFCPENATLGTPRPLTTLHDGHGRDVLAGRARVLETTGRDVTRELIAGAEAMLARARADRVELAIMLEISDSCGSHAVYVGPPEDRRYQQGPGVAAATLMDAGIPVLGQRDYATMQRLLALLDPTFVPDPEARDFVDQGWYGEYFADARPAILDES